MQKLLPISAGILVISGVVSFTMWSDLKKERKLTSDLQTQLTEANNRIQALTLEAHNRGQQVAAVVPTAANTADAKADAPAAAKAPPAPVPAALSDYQAREKEMMKDPEYRKARLAQQRMNTARNYPGLAEELGLSQKDADRLFDMLTESEANRSAELSALFAGNRQPDQAGRDEMQRKIQALQRQEEEQVSALLGPGKSAEFQEYKKTQGGRTQAAQWGTQLAQAGQPLSDVQQRGLTTVIVAEQKRLQQENQQLIQQMQQLSRGASQGDAQARMQLQEQAMKIQEDANRHLLDAAAAHLTPRQVSTLKQQLDNDLTMSRAQMRMEQRRVETQGAGQ